MIFYISTVKHKSYWTVWSAQPTLTFCGSYPVYRANADAFVLAEPALGISALFPNFNIDGDGGVKKIEVTEMDDGYFVKEIK